MPPNSPEPLSLSDEGLSFTGITPRKGPYFKLLGTQYAVDLVERGTVKITTLRRCRETEERTAGPGRSDRREGYMEVDFNFGFFRLLGPDQEMPEELAKEGYTLLELGEGRVRAAVRPTLMQQMHSSPDVFLYCVSYYRSRRMERRFASGDDSWVEIFDPDGFFGVLDSYMSSLGHTPKGRHMVEYRSRRVRRGERPRKAELIKDCWFAAENEIRAIWTPRDREPIQPLIVSLPELTRFCRMNRKIVQPIELKAERLLTA